MNDNGAIPFQVCPCDLIEADDKAEKLEKEANAKVIGIDLAQGESETIVRKIQAKQREE